MSRIRGTGNERTEAAFARLLRQHGIKGWCRHINIRLANVRDSRKLARFKKLKLRPWVRPDFVFPRHRVAIFIDGCFWHGCPCCYRRPRSNRTFWTTKVTRNRARDHAQTTALLKIGWRGSACGSTTSDSLTLKPSEHSPDSPLSHTTRKARPCPFSLPPTTSTTKRRGPERKGLNHAQHLAGSPRNGQVGIGRIGMGPQDQRCNAASKAALLESNASASRPDPLAGMYSSRSSHRARTITLRKGSCHPRELARKRAANAPTRR